LIRILCSKKSSGTIFRERSEPEGLSTGMCPAIPPGLHAGAGLALYEFASKAGLAGFNFQVRISSLNGDNAQTWPMTTNGQF